MQAVHFYSATQLNRTENTPWAPLPRYRQFVGWEKPATRLGW
jgi:hypothetical protein